MPHNIQVLPSLHNLVQTFSQKFGTFLSIGLVSLLPEVIIIKLVIICYYVSYKELRISIVDFSLQSQTLPTFNLPSYLN